MEPCSVITRLEVDFVLPMSQEEEEEEQQQQPTKYLSCYWPDFDQTVWTQIFGVLIFVDQNFFGPKVKSCA